MDSTCEQKKMKVEYDRLSSLPEGLIHKILSFIGTKLVVQTSALSSRWRYTWTSVPYLDFSSDDFANLPIFSKFVTHVLSGRNNEVEVSCLKLRFRGKVSQVFVKRLLNYAVSHNVQQMIVTCLLDKDIDFPLSVFSSPSVKNFTLTTECCGIRKKYCDYVHINPTSTWELPALTTLYLSYVTLCDDYTEKCIGVFSKCANLRNMTLSHYKTTSPDGFTISHPQLSNLTLENGYRGGKVVNVVAPHLESFTIINYALDCQHLVSAPNLTSLVCKGYGPLQLNTDGFPVLMKADLYISRAQNAEAATKIVCLLEQLHTVKSLTLSLEIIELLSSSIELLSRLPSPFSNLKSLAIYPINVSERALPKENVTTMSIEVKSYLLDNSPSATFTMVLREEIIAPKRMSELQMLLEKEKASVETNRAHKKRKKMPMRKSWENLGVQFERKKSKACLIISRLKGIKRLLTRLPASKRATFQPCYANLCADSDFVMSKITESIKNKCDENQNRLSVSFRELDTTLQLPRQ
ncbi:F-box protein At1g60400-like isoform X2 [Rutidosis leptorrhynchoides]